MHPPVVFEKIDTQQTESQFYNSNAQQVASETEVGIQKPQVSARRYNETNTNNTKSVSDGINVLKSDGASRTIEVLSIQEAKLNLEILKIEKQL